jgi:hypothetical protein
MEWDRLKFTYIRVRREQKYCFCVTSLCFLIYAYSHLSE